MTTQTGSLQRIADQLRRMHDGDAWHGPSITEALDGITAEQATQRPIAEAHTIYELVFHMAAWTGEVLQRLEGRAPQMPDEGDFPAPVPHLSAVEWANVKQRLADRHSALADAIAGFDESRLGDFVSPPRDAPLGTGVTYDALFHGLIQHDAYHAGQLMLLSKAIR
jgi:uncharacterized damage-inducible protein DinB